VIIEGLLLADEHDFLRDFRGREPRPLVTTHTLGYMPGLGTGL
jgi:hypothetical protein